MKTNEEQRIISDPKIRFGKPTIRGTRITVEDVLRLASRGLSTSEILEQYPRLTEHDVLAAHEFAADHLRDAFASHHRPDGVGSWQSDGPEWTTVECSN